jgi:hypothetical protein
MTKPNPITAAIATLEDKREWHTAKAASMGVLIDELKRVLLPDQPESDHAAPPVKADVTIVPRRKYAKRILKDGAGKQVAVITLNHAPKPRGPYKPRQPKPGLPPLDITAPKKPGRPPKAVQTPEQAKTSVETLLDSPATFAGACKRVMWEASHAMTVVEIFTAVEAKWPSLCAEKDAGNVAANLSYAAAQGKVEKLGMGHMATWRILDMEFFKETQA